MRAVIDIRINSPDREVFRPVVETAAVHPTVPYARHGLNPRERSAGMDEALRRKPGRRRDEASSPERGRIDEWA